MRLQGLFSHRHYTRKSLPSVSAFVPGKNTGRGFAVHTTDMQETKRDVWPRSSTSTPESCSSCLYLPGSPAVPLAPPQGAAVVVVGRQCNLK